MKRVSPELRIIASRMRKARIAAGLSQTQVADRLGLDRSSVSQFELGNQAFTVDKLYIYAEVIGVELVDMMPRRGEREELSLEDAPHGRPLKPPKDDRQLRITQGEARRAALSDAAALIKHTEFVAYEGEILREDDERTSVAFARIKAERLAIAAGLARRAGVPLADLVWVPEEEL